MDSSYNWFLGSPKLKGSANLLKGSVIPEPLGWFVRKIVSFWASPEWPQAYRFGTIWVSFCESQLQLTGFLGPPWLKGSSGFLKGSVVSEPQGSHV